MSRKQCISAGLGLGATLLCSTPLLAAVGPDRNFGLEVKITAESEDDRDLDTRNGGDTEGIALDLRPWVYGQRGNWGAMVMLQAVTGTDIVETDPIAPTLDDEDGTAPGFKRDNSRDPDKSYLALREFWIDYSGLTSYPGEHLRLGRQRVRSPTNEGTWWDIHIESLNWVMDTSLLRAQLGVAERFDEYRTDLDNLSPEDKDRTHAFGGLDYQWRPGHWAGLKVHHTSDDGDLPDSQREVYEDKQSKSYTGDLTWLGVHLDGDFFNHRSTMPLNYWAEFTWLTGEMDKRNFASDGRPDHRKDIDVDAWAVDLGLRWSLNDRWKIGAAYARASGGEGDDESEQFIQTGMHSNRSSFTGLQTRIHRFGEAFRGELTNMQVGTLFTSWKPNQDYEASVIYHRFWRVDDDEELGQNAISPFDKNGKDALKAGEKDLGQEVDLVVTRYFNQGMLPAGWGGELDEQSALIRLRGGLFFPGSAYASKGDTTMHRVFVDMIWRF
ncbi:alginate export family protein [Azotobacter armeniacus]